MNKKLLLIILPLLLLSACDFALLDFFTPEDNVHVEVQFNSYLIDKKTNQPKSEFMQILSANKYRGTKKTGSVDTQSIYSDVNGRSIMRFGFNLHPKEYIKMCSITMDDSVCEIITFEEAKNQGSGSVSMIKELRVLV